MSVKKKLELRGRKYTNWVIHYDDESAILCVDTLLVSHRKTLQGAIQDLIDIELEDPCEDE